MPSIREFRMRENLGRFWDSLIGDGWSQLANRAGGALTRFRHDEQGRPEATHDGNAPTESPRTPGVAMSHWGMLPADVWEDADRVRVRLEVPGLDAGDFDISVMDDMLTIRGEKRSERRSEEGRTYVVECSYGSFERVVPLPAAVDCERAEANYRNGVLSIELPKTGDQRSRTIEVRTG